jgi:hypothetical protein
VGGEEEREGGVFDMWKDMSRGMWSCGFINVLLPPFLKKCLMFLRKHLQFAKMEAPLPTHKRGGTDEHTESDRKRDRDRGRKKKRYRDRTFLNSTWRTSARGARGKENEHQFGSVCVCLFCCLFLEFSLVQVLIYRIRILIGKQKKVCSSQDCQHLQVGKTQG